MAAREPEADRDALGRTCAYLRDAYHEAADHVNRTGYGQWQRAVIHGDWHPGNILFRDKPDQSVVAVLDFDSARLEPLMADVANAACSSPWNCRRGTSRRPGPSGSTSIDCGGWCAAMEAGGGI